MPNDRNTARGLSPIGNHLTKPGSLAGALGSATPKSWTNSSDFGITGLPSPAKPVGSSTGTGPSETGSGAPPTTEVEAHEVLALATPSQVDANLRAWLKPSVVSSIASVTRWRNRPGTDEYSEPYIADYKLRGGFEESDARDALRQAELLNAPAAPPDCALALGKLKTITVSRNATAEDLMVQIAAMTEELCVYPLDVARDACRVWARSNKFFPTWAELRELCEERVLFRRALVRELRRYLSTLELCDVTDATPAAKAPPAITVWRDHREQLSALPEWPLLRRAIPDADDGATLQLAVEGPAIGFAILAYVVFRAEPVLGRRITCVVRRWVEPALYESGIIQGGAPNCDPHRRDGELVTLEDPAWRIWQERHDRFTAVEGWDMQATLFPDDYDGRSVTLLVPDVQTRWAIEDSAKPQIEAAFECPIRIKSRRCASEAISAATRSRMASGEVAA